MAKATEVFRNNAAFGEVTSPKYLSERWIRGEAENHDLSYAQLMEGARNYVENDEYLYHPDDYGRFEGESLSDEFWEHYEIVTGKRVPSNKQHSFFSCSC